MATLRRVLVMAGTVAVGVALAAAPTSASLPKGTLTTFSESWFVPTEKTLKKNLSMVIPRCPRASASASQLPPGVELPPGVTLPPGLFPPVKKPTTKKPRKLRKVSFAVALRRAQALGRSGKAGRLMARLSKRLKNEGDARGLAVAATLGGSPRLVLGGLLEAHRRDPRDAMNLVNAAVPLALLGKPAEALALLDRAAGVGARGSAATPRLAKAMGIPGRAVLENNRGYALLKLGRAAESVAPLRRAIALGGRPLAEAHSNLAFALVCSGGSTDEAVKLIRKSFARRPLDYLPPRMQLPGGIVELPESPWADKVYDLKAAKDKPLPQFKWPSTPEQSSNAVERMAAISAASNAKSGPLNSQYQDAIERVNALKESRSNKLRRSSMLNAVNQSDDEPELGKLHDRVLAAFGDVGAHTDAHWSVAVPAKQRECLAAGGEFDPCFIPWCQSTTASAQGGFNSRMALLDQLAHEYWQRAGRRESGIVAHLKQPDYHAAALANMQLHGEQIWSLLPSATAAWVGATTFMKPLCVAGQEAPPDSDAVAAGVEDPGACPDALKDFTGSFAHGIEIPPPAGKENPIDLDITVEIGCDSLEIEIAKGVDGTGELISVFGKGEADFKKDEVTLVIGVKGGIGGLAEGESGLYVKTGKDGVKDYGWRVGLESKLNAVGGVTGSGVNLKAYGGSEDISFVGAVDNIPEALGLR